MTKLQRKKNNFLKYVLYILILIKQSVFVKKENYYINILTNIYLSIYFLINPLSTRIV